MAQEIKDRTPLGRQVAEKSKFGTSDYGMEVGLLADMYERQELIFSPDVLADFEKQDASQKVMTVEAVMLKMPFPSLAVVRDSSGKWKVEFSSKTALHLCALFELMGLLSDEYPSVSDATYLSELNGMVWRENHDSDEDSVFTRNHRWLVRGHSIRVQSVRLPQSEDVELLKHVHGV